MSEGELKEAGATHGSGPDEFKSEFQPLIDELYREEVLDARKMSPEEKFLLGEYNAVNLTGPTSKAGAASTARLPNSMKSGELFRRFEHECTTRIC